MARAAEPGRYTSIMNELFDPFWILTILGIAITVIIFYATATLVIFRDYWKLSDLYKTLIYSMTVMIPLTFLTYSTDKNIKNYGPHEYLWAAGSIIVSSLFYGITVLAERVRKGQKIPEILIISTIKCPRCGLRYPKKDGTCPHCNDLTDDQVTELKAKYEAGQAGDVNLGHLFLYIAGLLTIGMLIFLIK